MNPHTHTPVRSGTFLNANHMLKTLCLTLYVPVYFARQFDCHSRLPATLVERELVIYTETGSNSKVSLQQTRNGRVFFIFDLFPCYFVYKQN